MNRRQFAGLSLAALGGIFAPKFGQWYKQGRGLWVRNVVPVGTHRMLFVFTPERSEVTWDGEKLLNFRDEPAGRVYWKDMGPVAPTQCLTLVNQGISASPYQSHIILNGVDPVRPFG